MNKTMGALLLTLFMLPATAIAQLATLDRQGPDSIAIIQLDTVLDTQLDELERYNRLDVYGQYVMGEVGAYANVPIGWTEVHFGDDQFVVGNIEVGAVYAMELPTLSITLHGGVLLPTLSENVRRPLVSLGRLTDTGSFVENTMALRFGGTLRVNAGILFAQADLGLDYAIGDVPEAIGEDMILRANGAIGVGMPFFDIALESANRGRIGQRGPATVAGLFQHTVALTAIGKFAVVNPYVSFLVPIDEETRGEDWNVTVGVQIGLM
jgi:hypothetical protein